MDFAERYLYLRSMPGGPKFSEAGLLPLAEHAEEVVFRRGARLFDQGALPDCVYFLMQGRVEMLADGVSRGFIESPGAIGILAVMGDCEMPYDVVARDEVVALAVDTEFFRETFEENFDIALEIVGSLSAHLLSKRKTLPARMTPELELPPTLLRAKQLGLVERMLIVRRFDIFGPGALTGLTEVAQQFEELQLIAGEELFHAGSHADTFHILLEGVIEMEWPESKEEVTMGPMFSNLETFGALPRGATARAKTHARLLVVSWETLIDVFEDHTEMVLAIIARLAQAVIQFTGSVFSTDIANALPPTKPTPAASTQIVPQVAPPSVSDVLPASGAE